jgi:two-component system cell cycle sensor histidine kinase/response regulator CckA
MKVGYDIPEDAAVRGEPIGDAEVCRELRERPGLREAPGTPTCERDGLLRRMQFQFERMPLAFLQFDEEMRLTDWNPAAERIFGYQKSEVLGMGPPFEKILPAAERQHVDELIVRLRAGDMSANSVNENLTKDGRTIICEWFNTPLIDDDGQFCGLLCLGQDMTQRRYLEDQLRQSQKMEAVGQLAGGVAHDFNNLLTIIIGYSEMLLELLGSDPFAREPLEEIRKAGERCSVLTRQLLLFSRKQVHAPTMLNLNDVLRDSVEVLQRLLGEDIELTTSLDPELGSIQADPSQLEQVLLNLAVNGRDAMPNGGRLTIETANVELNGVDASIRPTLPPGRYVRLKVADTGSGMTDDVKYHLFEPFFTTKEQGKGTGLGLPVVHGVIHQSHGHIDVESEVNAGTTFTIYLPRVNEVAQLSAS